MNWCFLQLLLVTSFEPPSTDPYPLSPQPSTKHTGVLQKEPVADEILLEVLTVNGSHETNGSHKAIQDDEEMVDVEGIVDQPVEVVATQPAISEGFAVPTDSPPKMVPEEPANGHIGTSADEVAGDITFGEKKPE